MKIALVLAISLITGFYSILIYNSYGAFITICFALAYLMISYCIFFFKITEIVFPVVKLLDNKKIIRYESTDNINELYNYIQAILCSNTGFSITLVGKAYRNVNLSGTTIAVTLKRIDRNSIHNDRFMVDISIFHDTGIPLYRGDKLFDNPSSAINYFITFWKDQQVGEYWVRDFFNLDIKKSAEYHLRKEKDNGQIN